MSRFIGLDIGAETLKLVELREERGVLTWVRRQIVEHRKAPGDALREILASWDWPSVESATVSGRLARTVQLAHIPAKQALSAGCKQLLASRNPSVTVVSIGSHGFSVLELRPEGLEILRESSRCSQGTGNFLRQLVERFDLDLEQACALCTEVVDPAPLSGRCPVILKTDMTHLANKGESRARILAGLFDAVSENVQVLVKPHLCPPRLLLAGGVTRAGRIRAHFRRFCETHQLELVETSGDDALYLEALGCAALAAECPRPVPALQELIAPAEAASLERVPALSSALPRVRRMAPCAGTAPDSAREVVLGFDIGSTGSKAVALDLSSRQAIWEGYLRTNGDPVGAAQALMREFAKGPAGQCPVRGLGATGSGREIVGSLMAVCYGPDSVFVLNEIAAHAAGALHFDPRVDTIFEIGGQDAKYIRLCDGRVVDAAMNEACSAGTGSFIEEQGRKFSGIDTVAQLGIEALKADGAISLGQHCSVFMAEIIDEAVSAGTDPRAIFAGIYDSIVQNYLNRVKGSRSVGEVIFCQGMPFSSDALAAAVARQTGSEVIVPPNPGTVGALGIALLSAAELPAGERSFSPNAFLEARVEKKDTFICQSKQGCGSVGNKCRIDRITTLAGGERQRFTWGGGCALYDRGTRKKKLPDRAPDPFREREEWVRALSTRLSAPRGRPTVALTDELSLKSLFPFFATFLHELGFDLAIFSGADQAALKRGIEEANVPFCAPMQQYHGVVAAMAERRPDFLFLPMLREITRFKDEAHAMVCPIVQASPDLLQNDLGDLGRTRLVTTLVDAGPGNLESPQFLESCRRLATDFGVRDESWRSAWRAAADEQLRFDSACIEVGARALAFCEEHRVVPVAVLGRTYTIYNTVLNSNVPAILREQGALGIPVDCYPLREEAPIVGGIFWSYGQRNLRAAYQIRRTPGQYALYCSNYSCGPDSFTLHFFAYLMEGKPFSVVETDGHSGDAGTKTRVEAFLHCVREDLKAPRQRKARCLKKLDDDRSNLGEIMGGHRTLLIPRMGPGAEVLAAAMRGVGASVECLPIADRETMRVGRRHTSGKECVPACITLGGLLQRVAAEQNPARRFSFLMPTAYGPCRFGVYNLLQKVVLERLGLQDQVKVLSPSFSGYFAGLPDGFAALAFTSLACTDMLLLGLYDVRPVERRPGAAQEIFARHMAELAETVEEAGKGDLSASGALLEVASGRLFGVRDLLGRAGAEWAAVKSERRVPAVLLVGEIYVRCDPFANDFMAQKLEERGLKVRFAPFTEWLEYTDYINYKNGERAGFLSHLSSFVRGVIQALTYSALGERLGWPERTTVKESLIAAAPYLREEFQGESVLTLGGPIHEWREGLIDGAVSVGPLECMPNKIAESQFFHVAEKEGLLSLTVSLNGDPIATEALDNFAFEVHARFRKKDKDHAHRGRRRVAGPLALQPLQVLGDMSFAAARNAMRLAAWATGQGSPLDPLR
jgi:predicted CoA-substrate-specific enzyme activase